MHHLIIFALLLSAAKLTAQETKKVTTSDQFGLSKEEYYVLKSDKTTRQGAYTKIGYKNKVETTGYYDHDLKDSLWTQYYPGTTLLRSQGMYSLGQKTGEWTYYHNDRKANILSAKGIYIAGQKSGEWNYYQEDGTLSQRYDHSNRKMLFVYADPNELYTIKSKTDGLKTISLDQPPTWIGDKTEIYQIIYDHVRYPKDARMKGIQGTVNLSFFIDEHGHAVDHYVEGGIGYGCDEEALAAIKSLPDNWQPGMLKDQPVIAKYTLPLKFILQ